MINGPNLEVRKRLRAKPFFRWYDLWIGGYINTEAKSIHICPIIPMFGIKFWIEEYRICEYCGEEMNKRAHHTGDGWMLHWDCDLQCSDGEDRFIEWPFGNEWLTGDDLKHFGYEVV